MIQILGAAVFASVWLLFNVVDWIPPGRVNQGITRVLLAVVVGTLFLSRGAFDAGFQRIVADISNHMVAQIEGILAEAVEAKVIDPQSPLADRISTAVDRF